METLESATVPGWHAAHFYESDAELAGTAARFIADAVRAGGVAIAIATDAHRHAISAELERAGIDFTRAVAERTVIFRPAAESLAMFMRGGRVDEVPFRGSIGNLVGVAAATGGPVHIYGDMVSMLWEAGDVEAAIELEAAWNRLGRDHRFSLLCGYGTSCAAGADAIEAICKLHSSVETSRQFRARADAPRDARRFVHGLLERCGYGEAQIRDAKLVISELTTNACVHARSAFDVLARMEDGELLLSVADESEDEPTLISAGPSDPRGRGLLVVDAVSSDWGVDSRPGGKAVWARLQHA